jgi:predicted MFS family arabinose efflux permease
VLTHGRVVAIVGVMLLESAASIMVYTYAAALLGGIAHISGTELSVALLAWGAGGVFGAFGSGWLTDRWGAERTLTAALILLIITLAALSRATSIVMVVIVMLFNGAAGWAVSTPNNHRLTALVPTLPSVVISFNASGIYLGQAIGAALGGFLLDGDASVRALCLIGAGIAVLAAVLHALIGRPEAHS